MTGSSSKAEVCLAALPFFFLSFLLEGASKVSCGSSKDTDRVAAGTSSSSGVTGSLSRLPAFSRFFLSFFERGASQTSDSAIGCGRPS